jgi:biotin carboxyl carrier protein
MRTGGGWDEALVQQSVWITAHFTRLAVLLAEVRDEQRAQRLQEQLRKDERPPRQQQQQQQPQQAGKPYQSAAAATAPPTASATSTAASAALAAAGTRSTRLSFQTAASSVPTTAAPVNPAVGEGKGTAGGVDMAPFLIVIQGHDWNFLAATRDEQGGTACSMTRTNESFFPLSPGFVFAFP